MFRGVRSCLAKRLINHPCNIKRRLLAHREVEVGRRVSGNIRARAIIGIPKYVGLKN